MSTAGGAITVHGLVKEFVNHHAGSKRRVLDGVELAVPAGSCVALTGASGSGKSSLLRCLYRTYLPDAGSALVDVPGGEVDMAVADERTVLDVRRRWVALVSQFLRVVPRLSARTLVCDSGGMSLSDAGALLAELGLTAERVDAPPATFSGGERQLVNIAMALARSVPVLFLDEATAALDSQRRARVLAAVRERKQAGTTVLAVFHDVPAIGGLVDDVRLLKKGRVV